MAAPPTDSEELTVHCAACRFPTPANRSSTKHRASHNGETYTLYSCPVCELQFWWPLKADPSVYAGEGFDAYKDYHAGTRSFPRWADPLFRALPERLGSALDIGCGDGAVLSRLAAAGFEVNGIDLDEKSVQVARAKFGLDKVVAITLDDYIAACKQRGLRFDLITFFEVLEHQDAPLEFLSQVGSISKSGSVIAGSVPNRDRFLARLDRRLSDGDLPPHHFLWLSRRSLARLLESSGFKDITIDRVGSLPYRQIVAKLRTVIYRKTGAWPLLTRALMVPILVALSPLAAIILWMGMRFKPSHLFFMCHPSVIEETGPHRKANA